MVFRDRKKPYGPPQPTRAALRSGLAALGLRLNPSLRQSCTRGPGPPIGLGHLESRRYPCPFDLFLMAGHDVLVTLGVAPFVDALAGEANGVAGVELVVAGVGRGDDGPDAACDCDRGLVWRL